MQKTYFFMQGEDMISPASPVFLVKVGESKKQLCSFKWLCAYAKRFHRFLKPAIRENEQLIKSMMLPSIPDSEPVCIAMMIVQVNVIDLVNAIPYHRENELVNPKAVRDQLFQLRNALNPIGFVSERSDENNLNVLTYSRKNLSQQSGTPICDVCCPFATRCPDYHVARLCQCYDADDRKGLQAAMNKLLLEPACDHDVEPVK